MKKNKSSQHSLARLALLTLSIGTVSCAFGEQSDASESRSSASPEFPVLECFREYADRYSDTNASPTDIATAAYAACYTSLLQFTELLRSERSSDPVGAINIDERVALARSELEKRAHAAALDQVLRIRFKKQ